MNSPKHLISILNTVTMSERSVIHFLKITGLVGLHKKTEFESTVKFACGLIIPECVERSLSVEVLFGHQYYFFTSWNSENALRHFMHTEEFHLVRGAFDALGTLQKIEIGYDAEIKTISIHHP